MVYSTIFKRTKQWRKQKWYEKTMVEDLNN